MNTYEMSLFLIEQRKKNNYTQKDIAELCSVSTQAVSKWERGDSVPDIVILEKLSRLYNTTINEIINGKSKCNRKSFKNEYIVSLTMSVLVFLAYFMNFVTFYVMGGPNLILSGFDIVLSGTSGMIVIICWVIFLVLVSYLLINIFLITKVIAVNRGLRIYIHISGLLIILLTFWFIVTGDYILLPHLIVISSVVVQLVVFDLTPKAICKALSKLKEEKGNNTENKAHQIVYLASSGITHILIIVGMFTFFLTDVRSSDIASMIIVPCCWLVFIYSSIKLLKYLNNSQIKYQLLKYMVILIVVCIGFAFVTEAMGYASTIGILVIMLINFVLTLLYLLSLCIKRKQPE